MKNFIVLIVSVFVLFANQSVWAYVGPGAGLSLLGALWGLLLAVGAALGFIILWPLRQARKKVRRKREMAEVPVYVEDRGRKSNPPVNR